MRRYPRAEPGHAARRGSTGVPLGFSGGLSPDTPRDAAPQASPWDSPGGRARVHRAESISVNFDGHPLNPRAPDAADRRSLQLGASPCSRHMIALSGLSLPRERRGPMTGLRGWIGAVLLLVACGGSGGGGGGEAVEVPRQRRSRRRPTGDAGRARLGGPAADSRSRHGESAIAAAGGKLYVFGGYDTEQTVEIYDIAADTWTGGTVLPAGHRQRRGGGVPGEDLRLRGRGLARGCRSTT